MSEIFSLFGTSEVLGTLLLVLFAVLYLRGCQALAGRLLVIFVVTGSLEFAMKLLLPQVRLPNPRIIEEFSVLSAIATPYAYPSGHMLRGGICLGALCFLSRSRLLQVGVVLVLLGLAGSRIYLEAHWPSDVVGGALLGASALLWAFGKEDQASDQLWLLRRRPPLLRSLSPKSINV